jgi:hypothetical protein
MASKSKAAEPQGRKREILGICLLGMGIFSVLSLISMHAGNNRMMGPGGAAAAAGLYSLAGFGAYLVGRGDAGGVGPLLPGKLLQRGSPRWGGRWGCWRR